MLNFSEKSSVMKNVMTMKNAIRLTLILAMVAVLASCRDKAAEKRIAELEARLAAIEGNKNTTTPAIQPSTQTAPVTEEKPDGPLPVIEFENTDHDFGTIKEGVKVQYTYKFKNTGQAPLIIQGA